MAEQTVKIKFEAELEEAVQFVVELPEALNEYAMHWLAICNNAREYPKDFLKVENASGNNVYVACPKSSAKSMKDFLEWHGEVKEERRVYVCRPEYVYEKKSSDFISSLYDGGEDEPWDIVNLAPEEL